MVDLQAHRGGRGLAPENTLAAFDKALSLGVTTLELDIGVSADGMVVIHHDPTLNADFTRDASGAWLPAKPAPSPAVHALTLAQLQRYDVGRLNPATSYGQQFATQVPRDGERIPTLASLFALVEARGDARVRFNIETKISPLQPGETAAPEAMVRALLTEIDKARMGARVTVQSFDWRTLALVGQLAPQLPRAYLTSARTLQDSRWTAGLQAASFASVPLLVKAAAGSGSGPLTWSPAYATLTPALVKEAQALGMQVVPWTVNKPADMATALGWGVNGVITDYPNLLREVIRGRGLPLPVPSGPSAPAARTP
ncbi:MAG: glycerophosphodiester phosphodiesterase [Variovorax sp.]|nr:MAG: glycerophosphodiester phosphodiesterase [Variovorax sp.]